MIPVQNHYNIGVFSLLNLHTTQFIVVYIPFQFIDVYQHTARINLLGNHYFDNLGLFRGLFFTKKKGG